MHNTLSNTHLRLTFGIDFLEEERLSGSISPDTADNLEVLQLGIRESIFAGAKNTLMAPKFDDTSSTEFRNRFPYIAESLKDDSLVDNDFSQIEQIGSFDIDVKDYFEISLTECKEETTEIHVVLKKGFTTCMSILSSGGLVILLQEILHILNECNRFNEAITNYYMRLKLNCSQNFENNLNLLMNGE